MMTKATAQAFALAWIEAWNGHDLDAILAHYTDDFVFDSPFIPVIAGEPSGTLRGKAAVGAYWAKALARTADLRFELVEVLWGIRSVVIRYRRHDGRPAAEWFELDAAGLVVRSAAHYGE